MKTAQRALLILMLLVLTAVSLPGLAEYYDEFDDELLEEEVSTADVPDIVMTPDSLIIPPGYSPRFGVLYIPESLKGWELPDHHEGSWVQRTLKWDPFLTGIEGWRAYVTWDGNRIAELAREIGARSEINTEHGEVVTRDLRFYAYCALEAVYPEGNYMVRVIAFYRNDAERSLISYHITYQTDEREFYVISYFGHHYREKAHRYDQIALTDKEKEDIIDNYPISDEEKKAAKEVIIYKTNDKKIIESVPTELKNAVNAEFENATREKAEVMYYDLEAYRPVLRENGVNSYRLLDPANEDDDAYFKAYFSGQKDPLTNAVNTVYEWIDYYYTPYPDTIYRGRIIRGDGVWTDEGLFFDNIDLELRNGSGKYMGSAAWFEWDYGSGEVTLARLDDLRRLYSFPTPRVRVLSEMIELDPDWESSEWDDSMDSWDDTWDEDTWEEETWEEVTTPEAPEDQYQWEENPEGLDEVVLGDWVFFDSTQIAPFTEGYTSAAEMAQTKEGRALLSALAAVEFSEQQPDISIDSIATVFVGTMEDMAYVALDTDLGYVRFILQLNPLMTCYGYTDTHSPDIMHGLLALTCDNIWTVSEDDFINTLTDVINQIMQ